MLIRKVIVLAILLFCQFSLGAQAFDARATKYAVIATKTGQVLFSNMAEVRSPPASTTKLMTVLLALEYGKLHERVETSPHATRAGGSSLYLRAGDRYSLESLIYAAMLISANDACVAIAEHISGSEVGFVRRAKEIGMNNTTVQNPHGMPMRDHLSTAKDLAILGSVVVSIPKFTEIAGATKHVLPGGRIIYNQNKLLGNFEGILSGKMGYTDEAGQCFVANAERNGLNLVSVVLGSRGSAIWDETEELLTYGFTKYSRTTHIRKYQTLAIKSNLLIGDLLLVAGEDFSVIEQVAQQSKVATLLLIDRYILPPVNRGEVLGSAEVYVNGVKTAAIPLVAAFDVPLFTATRVGLGVAAILLLSFLLVALRR
ncbi:MAG: D-alanyl-D-alanine carboxypeptidase family protein [bacterium]|nr:D-alanyl-D-alanine carboxypeptidase family protein [bacterium]